MEIRISCKLPGVIGLCPRIFLFLVNANRLDQNKGAVMYTAKTYYCDRPQGGIILFTSY